MSVSSLGYVVVETVDLPRWQRFAADVLGLMPAASPRHDVALFRMDARPFRFWIEEGERDALRTPGWECAHKPAFDETLARLRDAGRPVELADVAAARARNVHELARSSDPAGNPMELYHGRFVDDVPFASPSGVSRFVTGDNGDMGLGHIVLAAPNFDETHDFYRDVLGFSDTDLGRFYLAGGGPDDAGVGFAFMHCNGRHHSLALGQLPESPNGAVHMMLEVGALADVGRAYDKALRSKGAIPVSATLGQHVNDKMTSFYVQSPSGFDIEYGWNGLVIDPASWVATTSMTVSVWGHRWAHEQD